LQPDSLHKWAYVENDPINALDPLGLNRYEIWAAAFINPPSIDFTYVYFPKYWDSTYHEFLSDPLLPGTIANTATWHGDGRTFFYAGSSRDSRVWHRILIDTQHYYPTLTISAGTGRTSVDFTTYSTYFPLRLITGWATAKAPEPPPARVTRDPADRCIIRIKIDIYDAPESGANPLGPPLITPSIRYQYNIKFDIRTRTLTYEGQHSAYPWHELYIGEVGNSRFSVPLISYSPDGRNQNPFDLYPFIEPDRLVEGPPLILPTDPEGELLCSACSSTNGH
jgi:hypothetical protein